MSVGSTPSTYVPSIYPFTVFVMVGPMILESSSVVSKMFSFYPMSSPLTTPVVTPTPSGDNPPLGPRRWTSWPSTPLPPSFEGGPLFRSRSLRPSPVVDTDLVLPAPSAIHPSSRHLRGPLSLPLWRSGTRRGAHPAPSPRRGIDPKLLVALGPKSPSSSPV